MTAAADHIRPECRPFIITGGRFGQRCTLGTIDCAAVAHARLDLAGHMNPFGLRPRNGWRPDTSPWWCIRCQTVQYGTYPWMHGGCPSMRAGRRCGTILLRLTPA